MKLVPAPGSPDMQVAISHPYVIRIVDILLDIIDQKSFQMVAFFLNKNTQRTLPRFTENLQDLRGSIQSRPDPNGNLTNLTHIEELITTLDKLYQQSSKAIEYQRGAIVELLAYELVQERCTLDECQNNHKFRGTQRKYESSQIDVAVLSRERQQIEGYACKIKPERIQSEDYLDLMKLVDEADYYHYEAHIGTICFDSRRVIQKTIQRAARDFSLTHPIYPYGVDNFQELSISPFDD